VQARARTLLDNTLFKYINIYIYISEVGGWVQPGNRFVSCVRARAVCIPSEIPAPNPWSAAAAAPFPFPFCPTGLSLFPCEIRCSFSLEINEIKGIQMRSSESKWIQVRSSEIKWVQVNPSEIKWVQVSPSEVTWDQVSPSEAKWDQASPSEFKWVQVRSIESKWTQVRSSESKWDQVRPRRFKWDPPSPQSSYPTLVGLIGIYNTISHFPIPPHIIKCYWLFSYISPWNPWVFFGIILDPMETGGNLWKLWKCLEVHAGKAYPQTT
jgi:hypothetical protein